MTKKYFISLLKENKLKLLILIVLLVLLSRTFFLGNQYAGVYRQDSYLPQSAITEGAITPQASKNKISFDQNSVDNSTIQTEDRKIIKTANITIQVKDGEESYNNLKQNLDKFGAFIDHAEISETYYEGHPKQASLTVRVESDKFEDFMKYLKESGYVKSENVSNQDVTENYQDLDAQLTNLKLREEKVREFYNKAKTVEETLSVYRELFQIQSDIDSQSRALKNLDNQISYSTVYVIFTPEIKVTEFSNPEWNISIVWKGAINDLIGALQSLATIGIRIFVYGAIWFPIVFIAFLIWRKRKSKNK
ncbi:MAG: hypothetical protein UR28_C0010G0054 [Candidatus Peregrinibacteria bacterium GW2011_GWF2_33_10]|nr:MAG: hypothetical protein UR28_C0010G0054 [Candidatus Peregrinibacteria bacterium GW2011_GWF2_33_10]OGJ46098.1 MAG: hypothetical protein A2272_05225 [Candidatus Peregrinibacteria bacterium RIFOXYA12_FULL_33_12]OGJ46197.1 MAG: hypothetical protein A2263_04900 [Candidatus Peregrinibacteria bacterium RIFOXYA2_FULL_33_21]OGJ51613.1 MAG: hypothetical protein A2307_04070 [Candidatus Peregrinibacteria bacterium RIFOXYB2_FULL_33_20]